MTSPAEQPPKLDELVNAEASDPQPAFIRLLGIYLAIVLAAAFVWLGVLTWTPLGRFCHDGYGVLFLPMWGCFGVSFVLAIMGGVAALTGKPVKGLGRWTIYSGITGFVFVILFSFATFVCDRAGAKLPF